MGPQKTNIKYKESEVTSTIVEPTEEENNLNFLNTNLESSTTFQQISIFNEEAEEIKDFGIYNYFDFNDNINKIKMMATIYPSKYVISIGYADKYDHYELEQKIENKYGKPTCFVASVGDELNVFFDEPLIKNQITALISIFKELKNYYKETGINKNIMFIEGFYRDKFTNIKSCLDIDHVLNALNDLHSEFVLNEPTNIIGSTDIIGPTLSL